MEVPYKPSAKKLDCKVNGSLETLALLVECKVDHNFTGWFACLDMTNHHQVADAILDKNAEVRLEFEDGRVGGARAVKYGLIDRLSEGYFPNSVGLLYVSGTTLLGKPQ
ncbi:MAG TPA: hypothetical protein VFE78_34865 [Gemmataceae bacterium]|nr:hypothetical protein [Gemmataceae bacterium]